MIRKWGVLVFMLLVTPALAFAQSTGKLTGSVIDASTGEPLPGANVLLEGTTLGTATDVDGNYLIIGVPVGTYDVRATFVGFQDQLVEGVEISSGYTREIDFSLSEGLELGEIVVTYERPLIQKDAIGAPRVMTADQIQNLPVRGVASIASLQSGVVSQGETSDLFVRGGREEEIVYYVDGVKVNGLLSVNQDAIAEQEMLIGTIPARYGDTQSGVISITTRSGGADFFGSLEGITSEVLDPYGYNLGSFSLGGPIVPRRAGFFVSGQYTDLADSNPYGVDTYRLTDDALASIQANPQVVRVVDANGNESFMNFPWETALAAFNNGTPLTADSLAVILGLAEGATVADLVNAPDIFTADDFDLEPEKHRPYNELILNGNLSFNPTDAILLRVGASFENQDQEEQGFANSLYNRDVFYHDERDNLRFFGSLQHRFSDRTFYQLRFGYEDWSYVQYPNGFSDDVRDAFLYGDLENDYLSVASRYFASGGSGFTPRYTSDGTASVGAAAGVTFNLPGTPLATFQKQSIKTLQFSGSATTQVGVHQLEFGGEYQQLTNRWYNLAGFGLARFFDDGSCEQNPCVSSYEELPFSALNTRAVYWGYDFRGLNEVDDQDIDDYFTVVNDASNERANMNVAPYKPIYYAGYLQDKIEYRDLVINLGLRIDVFDNNTQVLKDVYAPLPIVRAGTLNNTPGGVGSDYAVYFNDSGDVVGYRDLDGNFYDTDGSRIGASVVTGQRSGQVQGTNEARSSAFEDYEPEVTVMPRVGVSFPVTDRALFFASYNVTSQRPTEQAFTPFRSYEEITTQNSRTPNASLRPEKTTQYELGFRQRLGARAAMTLSGFYRTQENKISNRRLTGGFPSYGTYLNADFTTTKGVELGFDLRRTRNLAITANYTLAFAQGTGSDAQATNNIVWRGEFFPNFISPADFDQRHSLNAAVDYRFGAGEGPSLFGTSLLENFGIGLIGQYGSGFAYTALQAPGFSVNDSFTDDAVGTINSARLPSSYRVDLKVDRQFNLGFGGTALRTYLTVFNLFDTQNVQAVYRATGLPDFDGYLGTPGGSSFINSQPDPDAAIFNYQAYTGGPVNVGGNQSSGSGLFYGLPRRVRLGVELTF